VCYCEQITRGDVIQHLDSPLKPRTLDSIKRRTRAQMGRCQGFDCMVNIAEIISDHCEVPLDKISKRGPGSEIAQSLTSNYSDEAKNELN
jgi:glycerol-3-phosphate dehydrogenase